MQTESSLKIKLKMLFLKKLSGDDAKKTKRLTHVWTNKFTKRVFKKAEITKLFQPVNYLEIAANTWSN